MKMRTIARKLDKYLIDMRKMVFVSGPRQVGKTTMVESYVEEKGGGVLFNWDVATDQRRLARNPYFFEEENRTPHNIVVLDEIHKYARWKNYLKGAYDKYRKDFLFIVTGSGRLDLFQKGGDSLMGRYVTLPLFPFTMSELAGRFSTYSQFKESWEEGAAKAEPPRKSYDSLFELGGFPEPLLRGEKEYHLAWSQERRKLLVREDIRDTTKIRELSLLEMLSHLIVERVGSPLSINALREDVGVAFETVRDWIATLAQFYYLFLVKPFSGSLARTMRKEAKAYLFDWAEIDDPAARFENMIALHLLKSVKTWSVLGEGDLHLGFIRDKEKREVDFVIVEKKKPICLVEAKMSEQGLSPSLLYYQEKFDVPVAVQLLHQPGIEKKMRKQGRIQWVISADRWLSCLS